VSLFQCFNSRQEVGALQLWEGDHRKNARQPLSGGLAAPMPALTTWLKAKDRWQPRLPDLESDHASSGAPGLQGPGRIHYWFVRGPLSPAQASVSREELKQITDPAF
jgi:hypothetical protein